MNLTTQPIPEKLKEALHLIGNYRFFFAHHSVGENIIDGLVDIVKESGVNFHIARIDAAPLTKKINLAHCSPGKNTDPKSKIDGFAELIRKVHNKYEPNAALMKFCFVDFTPDTDIEKLIAYYREQMTALKKEMPDIVFAHITVPLTERPTGWKARLKRFLGLQVWGDASNVTRARFNALLRKAFPHDPIFDLARIESTRLDGTRCTFTYNGKVYPCLTPEYTNDGGHLNAVGRRIAASEFILFLRNIVIKNRHV